MKLDDALHGVTTLGIETAPFIYFIERNPRYVDLMRAIFQRVSSGIPQVVTSVITLTEVLIMPLRSGQVHYEREYREMLLNTDHITTVPVNVAIADRAARLRAQHNLRTPDALHVATAIVSRCEAFLTNDLALKRVQQVRVLVLDELEL